MKKYCKNWRCPISREIGDEPCEIAENCWLFEWDIDRQKIKPVAREKSKDDKTDKESKETQRSAKYAAKTAAQRTTTPLEEEEQRDFAEWLDGRGILWAHIPNERKASFAVMAALSRQGLKKGFPDNFIAVARGAWHGLFIELKRAKKCLSVRSKEQREWIKRLNAAGYKAMFCYGAEEAKKAVEEYLKGI